jgi:hypothetical protein
MLPKPPCASDYVEHALGIRPNPTADLQEGASFRIGKRLSSIPRLKRKLPPGICNCKASWRKRSALVRIRVRLKSAKLCPNETEAAYFLRLTSRSQGVNPCLYAGFLDSMKRMAWQRPCPYRPVGASESEMLRGANMNPRLKKRIWNGVPIFALLVAALFVSEGGSAYAQVHGFQSGSFGHLGQGAGGFHGGAVGPHWGVQQHGFGYGRGHVSNGWVPGWGHGHFGYSPYYGGEHSWGAAYYPYPLHRYPLYAYPRGHRRAYYFSRYHGFRNYGGRAPYYHGHH